MRLVVPALLLAALAGCATTTPHGLLRVDLPGPGTGPESPQERQLAGAVRDAAGLEGLVCQPGGGAAVLRCSAGALGNRAHAITLGLARSGTGYEVSIDQALSLPGRGSPVCDVQRRVAERIDAELQVPVARVDSRSDCKGK